MKGITKFLEKSIWGIGVFFFGWILVMNLFLDGIKYDCKNKCGLPNWILLIIGLVLISIAVFCIKKYRTEIEKILEKEERLIRILSVVLFVIELGISFAISFSTGWDAREVSWQASLVAGGDANLDNEYFSHYPNNLLITFFYSLIFRFAGLFGVQMAGSVFIVIIQCFLSVLTGHLLYKLSKKMFDNEQTCNTLYQHKRNWSVYYWVTSFRKRHSKKCFEIQKPLHPKTGFVSSEFQSKIPMLIWLVYSFWIGLLPWYMITYSDPVGILFPVLILWIYQSMENEKAIIQKSVLIGIISFIGYRIKPTVLIVYIALVIVLLLRVITDDKRKIRMKQIGCLLLSFLLFVGIYQQVDIGACMGFELDGEQELTITHFAMMGLSEKRNGIFDMDEVEYSLSFSDKSARQEANCEKIKERLQNYGFSGLLNHLTKKTLINYNDGTFAWGKEAEFFAEEVEKPEWLFSELLKEVYYNGGTYRVAYNTVLQMFWITTLFGGLLNVIAFFQKKKVSDLELITMLALIGLFLFVSMFEARARYVYVYAPLYMLMGVRGYEYLIGLRKRSM